MKTLSKLMSLKYCVLIFCVCYGVSIWSRPLVAMDEFRYGEIAKDVMSRGKIYSNRLEGVRYFEKPFLGHLLNACSMKIFGVNAFGLRFSSALLTLLTGLLVAYLVQIRLNDVKLSLLSFGFHSSFIFVYILGTTAILDAPFTFFATASTFLAFLAGCEDCINRRQVILSVLCGAMVAAGCYVKGFIGLAVPGISIATWLVVERRWKQMLAIPLFALPAFAAIMLPIAYAIHLQEPDFWDYFIRVEHIQRFMSASGGQHVKPWYYLLPLFAIGCFPALLFMPCALGINGEGWKQLFGKPIFRMALCGTIGPLIFFSASSGKLVTYILPCYPPMAILLAGAVMANLRTSLNGRLFRNVTTSVGTAQLVLGAIGLLAKPLAMRLPVEIPMDKTLMDALSPLVISESILLMISGMALLAVRHCSKTTIFHVFFISLGACALCSALLLPPELNNGKFPEKSLTRYAETSHLNQAETSYFASSSLMYAVSWVYKTDSVKALLRPGELDFGNRIGLRHGEESVVADEHHISSMIRDGKRNVVIITWDDEMPPSKTFGEIPPSEAFQDRRLKMLRY